MIAIVYCPGENRVLAAAENIVSATCHLHDPPAEGTRIENINEEVYPGTTGWSAGDGTIINNYDDWLTYLEKYIQ